VRTASSLFEREEGRDSGKNEQKERDKRNGGENKNKKLILTSKRLQK